MIGIDQEKARKDFNCAENIEPFTACAIGYFGAPELLSDTHRARDESEKGRKEIVDLLVQTDINEL